MWKSGKAEMQGSNISTKREALGLPFRGLRGGGGMRAECS